MEAEGQTKTVPAGQENNVSTLQTKLERAGFIILR